LAQRASQFGMQLDDAAITGLGASRLHGMHPCT
jgi:hypothetical protein